MKEVYVYTWFDPRTHELRSKYFDKRPAVEHLGEVKYAGSTFGVWTSGPGYESARERGYACLAIYFANRSKEYAKKAMIFAEHSSLCVD